ncbi:MAG TPA: hypothetical protein PK325_02715 [Cyclobacteriaceae bacterium]|nr:hypothetical protein [Cyclobacteriaceae bacterium]HMV07575.1 hypothetical protein [Cyclobacteriaceae bacterium]HMV89035.1 hypothetical protein [Cyclobacteriaceae bacterium]HMW98710.1 hypothetical protein [Cyclobacteriaceae bacterium]HMX48656.1 hypothetical protein [Cyclobacteriaceae bacterium]
MQRACWVLIIFLLVLGGSCLDNDICLRGADNALVIEFKKFVEGIPVTDTVTFLNIEAEGTNAVFYLEDPDVTDTLRSKVVVTINPYANETLFTFNDFKGVTKTLRVGYKTEVRFVSEECGSERLQYDLKVLETSFNTVNVIRKNLDKGRSTNIEIFN